MQQDRMNGNVSHEPDDEMMARLRDMGAKNIEPPLPRSKYIRIKATGEIHMWTEFFASRPDLCECCDEYGSTDSTKWDKDTIISSTMPVTSVVTTRDKVDTPISNLPTNKPVVSGIADMFNELME